MNEHDHTTGAASVRTARVRALLEALVRFPSLSGEETEIADWLRGFLRDEGFDVRRHEDNLWFGIGSGDDGLLLASHLDVVPASEGHPHPPFDPTVADGAVWGRGTVDAKGCVAAMTVALIELANDGWTPPPGGRVTAAFTACEERGWPYNGMQSVRPHLPPVSAAIIGEPTDLVPATAQKGLLILRIRAEGVSAHAARAELGRNAIVTAARDVARLAEFRPDRVHPVLGATTLNVTTIEGGTVRNMIPDRCTFMVDVRTTPAYSHAEMTALIADQVDSRVEVHSDRLIAVDTDHDERIVKAVLAAVHGSSPTGSPTLSDWVFLSDVPAVKIGPGHSEMSHTAREHITLTDLSSGVEAYRRIILQYFGSRP